MGNIKQNLLIDKLLFIFHSLFLSFFLYQLYIDNFRYYAFNNISFLKVIVLFIIIFFINCFTFFQFDNPTYFRIGILFEFYITYMITLIACKNLIIIYAPIITLLCVTFYTEKKLYIIHLLSFLGVISGYVCFTIFNSLFNTSINSVTSSDYITHLLICLVLSFCLTQINDILFKKISDICFTESLQILSIAAVESSYNPEINTLSSTIKELSTKTGIINEHLNQIKNTWSIAASDCKSVNHLSSEINRDLTDISKVTNDLTNITLQTKTNLISVCELLNSVLRTTLNINSTHKNLSYNLDNVDKETDLLQDMLIELENLSVVTTHLSTKTCMEANQFVNHDVMELIVKEFHDYSQEINKKIIHMSNTFKKLNSNYYACKSEMYTSDNLLASNGIIINNLLNSIEAINTKFNNILADTSQLESILNNTSIKSKHLTADSAELYNAMHQFGKVSFSLSKICKPGLSNGKYTTLKYLK